MRDGLLARLALAEAAGWLAHAHAWVHPLDLALRAAGLTAPAALAAFGAGARALTHTLAQPAGRLAWDDPPLDTLPDTEQAIADALAPARLLCRLPGGGSHPFGSAASAATTLAALGAAIDPVRLTAWWDAHAPRQCHGGGSAFDARRAGRHCRRCSLAPWRPLPGWQAASPTQPAPVQALLVAFGRQRVPPSCRCGAPPPRSGSATRDALPTLRPDTVERLGVLGSIPWPAAGLALIAESARHGLRELDRLEAAAAKGRRRWPTPTAARA